MSNISVDWFGNLDKYGGFWQELLKFAILEGHKVYIISGPWPNDLEKRLDANGYKLEIHYHGIFSILQTLHELGLGVWLDEDHDSWFSMEAAWWAAKAFICEKQNIALHLDSDLRFARGFNEIATRFIHTESKKGERLIKAWKNSLKLSNTYEDWGDDMAWSLMSGMVPS
jgi:hypothetical protein